MSVLLVRHGRTGANAAGELLGRRDPVLDEVGEAQAASVARALTDRLAGRDVRVVSSPLARAQGTASVIAAGFGVEVEVDDRWIELDYGELEGVPVAEVPAAVWAAWRADPELAPGGGESLAGLRRRVAPALTDAVARLRRSGEDGIDDLVVVSHVSPIKAAVTEVLGVGDAVTWKIFLSPGSITEVAVRGGGTAGTVLASFNETGHLPPAP